MSDTRRQIADRHAKTLLTSAKPDFMILESAMAEYAAAVLEEAAVIAVNHKTGAHWQHDKICEELAAQLRARATEERER